MNPVWAERYALSLDVGSLLSYRMQQKVYLARYGRIDPFSWSHRAVNELTVYYKAVSELLGKEKGLSRAVEDQ